MAAGAHDAASAPPGPSANAWAERLERAVVVALGTPDGRAALQGAVRRALDATGAPTRPGGTSAPLTQRWEAGEPLAEDTDWRSPLGGWRDTSVRRGTIGELGAALLTSGIYAGELVIERLVPLASALPEAAGSPARDDAEHRDHVRAVVHRVLAGPAKHWRLQPVLAGTVPPESQV